MFLPEVVEQLRPLLIRWGAGEERVDSRVARHLDFLVEICEFYFRIVDAESSEGIFDPPDPIVNVV